MLYIPSIVWYGIANTIPEAIFLSGLTQEYMKRMLPYIPVQTK